MDIKLTDRSPIWSLALLVIGVLILDPLTSISAAMTGDQSARLESNCTCIGYPLKVQCTTIGPGATIWQGSALNCPSSLNKIQLYHSRFASGTATGSCNNGNIVAHALDTVEGRYHSQLNIGILTPKMNETIIECLYDNGTHTQSINNITIITTREGFPPPMNISLSIVNKGQLHFSWDPIAPACAAIQYNINANNCGRCPNATTSTFITCTDVMVEDVEELCSFGISTVVCSDVIGVQNKLEVMLRVPNISMSTIDVIPTYENNTNNLTKLTTGFNTIENNMWSTDSVNSSVLSYTINYTDSNTGRSCGNSTIPATSCISGACSSVFYVKSSTCPSEANFTIKIYGTNALGDGKTSDPIKQDFVNHLVKVVAYPLKRRISCEFYYKSNSLKSCSATFFDEYCQSIIFAINGSTTGNYINLHYDPIQHSNRCYVIAANNGTMKVNISGILPTDTNHNRNYDINEDGWIAAVATLLPAIFVTTVTLFAIIAIACMHGPRRYYPDKKIN